MVVKNGIVPSLKAQPQFSLPKISDHEEVQCSKESVPVACYEAGGYKLGIWNRPLGPGLETLMIALSFGYQEKMDTCLLFV